MPTLRNRFHELANWHQKVILSMIMATELLSEESLSKLPEPELKETISRAIKMLEKADQCVGEANKTMDGIKAFVYKEISPDREMLVQNK